MKQFLGQKVEMKIPQKHYTGFKSVSPDEKLNMFLKSNFEFPSNNLKDISKFISQDLELENIIYDLPQVISKELSFTRISFDFMKETDISEKILEIIIYCNLDEETQFQKEDIISDRLIDDYPKTENEFLILVES